MTAERRPKLAVFKFASCDGCQLSLLVRAGDEGLIVNDIASHTDLPLSTLAHHLRALVSAGLVDQDRRGREIVSTVNFKAMNLTIGFLTEECCQGVVLKLEDVA